MSEDLDREWTQDELRAHVRAIGVTVHDSELIPQGCKYLGPPAAITEEDREWALRIIATVQSHSKW